MGFNSVYRSLQDIFPQVDARILRAVAIEHPKDADQAAEIVLTEIIPFISNSNKPPATPSQDNGPGVSINLQVEHEEGGNSLRHRRRVDVKDVGPSFDSHSIPVEITNAAGNCVEANDAGFSSAPNSTPIQDTKTAGCSSTPDLNVSLDESTLTNSIVKNSNDGTAKVVGQNQILDLNVLWNGEDNFTGEISTKTAKKDTSNGFRQDAYENWEWGQGDVDADSENLISSGVCQEMERELNHVIKVAVSSNDNGNANVNFVSEEFMGSVDTLSAENLLLKKCETAFIDKEDAEVQAVSHVQGDTVNDNLEKFYASSKQDFLAIGTIASSFVMINGLDCESNIIATLNDDSEFIIVKWKRTLFSSMESLMNLMREVELQEKSAKQANMEAATGGCDILARVEEYKTMLEHAKEANDMHAGEVYGEKAILATELRELQSRLLGLSEERDKSLAILDEMRQNLEARLAAAEELRKTAEREKLGKEESARKLLAEQEAEMEKVALESLRLQEAAEENSKLREFLMDRGQVVDMLQGEISVICQDVRLLKEKFDANLPLSQSFTAKETSCILASSGSSHKTLAASEAGSVHSDSSELLKTSPAASVASFSSKKSGHDDDEEKEKEKEKEKGKEKGKSKADDHKDLVDDGWDIFEW
ncbi:hypothetical protein PIB30_012444 [Stylosanthes scabra]|uniref:CUE domain-containing protein n=1 Tax=Stylosanthes scabra TaxID=79078 RepID=A0ABU6S5P2_9FABA|nr:hypothetical protein [Stylosanthes scabra]